MSEYRTSNRAVTPEFLPNRSHLSGTNILPLFYRHVTFKKTASRSLYGGITTEPSLWPIACHLTNMTKVLEPEINNIIDWFKSKQ